MNTRELQISEYNYPLPDDRIAKFPLTNRDKSKLLIYRSGEISESTFDKLPDFLPPSGLMVFNNTKVIQARLHFRKPTGALIEVFLLDPVSPADYEQMFQEKKCCTWSCMIGNLKKWKGEELSRDLSVNGRLITFTAKYAGGAADAHNVEFKWDSDEICFLDIIDAIGELPIPPYLNRPTQESDKRNYQTVYSKIEGSVAAPTAGLHFTESVLAELDRRGIEREELTLHVGAGTFKPVKSDAIGGHTMHTEAISVSLDTIDKLLAHDCKAIAVGTTSVRTLESLYYIGLKLLRNPDLPEEQLHVTQWEPYDSEMPSLTVPNVAFEAVKDYLLQRKKTHLRTSTQIIIVPGYKYKVVKALITNFHQPQSTLLLLVSAFVNGDWKRIYDYALAHDFRFLSYGDSSLLIP